MASKTLAQWKKEAEALAKELGVDAGIPEGAKIEDVQKIVEDLSAKVEAAKAELAKEVEAKQPEIKFEYSIAKGKAVTCRAGKRGMLTEGQEITTGMVGIESLKALVKRGLVVHNPNAKK